MAAQALSQPNPGHDDALAEAAMHAQAALHQTGALPAMGAVRILPPRSSTSTMTDVQDTPATAVALPGTKVHAAWPAEATQTSAVQRPCVRPAVRAMNLPSHARVRAQSPLRMPHGARALTEDAEGPRMSMAMRRQLGIAPTKSPSKASSASAREAPPAAPACPACPLLHTRRRSLTD